MIDTKLYLNSFPFVIIGNDRNLNHNNGHSAYGNYPHNLPITITKNTAPMVIIPIFYLSPSLKIEVEYEVIIRSDIIIWS